MPSQPPVTKRKPSAPRKETHLCDAFDHDLEMLFLTYYRHRQETSDASTDQLLSRFDAVGETGFRAFEDIAQLSQRLVRLDVALTSHRGGLLDTLDSLSSEYDSVIDAVLRALASFANYLLECRAPLRPSGPSCPPRVSEMEMAVKGWQAALAEVQIHANAIQEHWPQTIQVLETELNDLPPLPLLSWLRWMDPDNLKGNLRDLPHDLASIKDTAIRDMVSLMRACANLGSALKRNETICIGQRPPDDRDHPRGADSAQRGVYEGRMNDLNNSPLGDLLWAEAEYLREHTAAKEQMMQLLYRFDAGRFVSLGL